MRAPYCQAPYHSHDEVQCIIRVEANEVIAAQLFCIDLAALACIKIAAAQPVAATTVLHLCIAPGYPLNPDYVLGIVMSS